MLSWKSVSTQANSRNIGLPSVSMIAPFQLMGLAFKQHMLTALQSYAESERNRSTSELMYSYTEFLYSHIEKCGSYIIQDQLSTVLSILKNTQWARAHLRLECLPRYLPCEPR